MINLSLQEMIKTLRAIIRAELKDVVETTDREITRNPRIKLKPGDSFTTSISFSTIVRGWLWMIGGFYDDPKLVELSEKLSDLVGDDISDLNREGLHGLLDPQKTKEMEQHPAYKRLYGGKQLEFTIPIDAQGQPTTPLDLSEIDSSADQEKLDEEILRNLHATSGDLAVLIATTKLGNSIELTDEPESTAPIRLTMARLATIILTATGPALESAISETNRLIEQKTLNSKSNATFEVELQLFSVFCHCLKILGFVYDDRKMSVIARSMFALLDEYKDAPDRPDPQNKTEDKTHPDWDFISQMTIRIELTTDDDGRLIALDKLSQNHKRSISQPLYKAIREPETVDYFVDLMSKLTAENVIEFVDCPPPKPD